MCEIIEQPVFRYQLRGEMTVKINYGLVLGISMIKPFPGLVSQHKIGMNKMSHLCNRFKMIF
jgi:hypothetical protein